jgi:hypothetical protein
VFFGQAIDWKTWGSWRIQGENTIMETLAVTETKDPYRPVQVYLRRYLRSGHTKLLFYSLPMLVLLRNVSTSTYVPTSPHGVRTHTSDLIKWTRQVRQRKLGVSISLSGCRTYFTAASWLPIWWTRLNVALSYFRGYGTRRLTHSRMNLVKMRSKCSQIQAPAVLSDRKEPQI